MKLKDEQGNQWDFSLVQHKDEQAVVGYLSKVKPNPMPEPEEGDWYHVDSKNVVVWRNDTIDCLNRTNGIITEIRKADGTVWRRG